MVQQVIDGNLCIAFSLFLKIIFLVNDILLWKVKTRKMGRSTVWYYLNHYQLAIHL